MERRTNLFGICDQYLQYNDRAPRGTESRSHYSLSDELFRQFGSRVIRLVTLQRLRGNIERFRSANILWSFFTVPTDPLMLYADEANKWINCGSKHVRYAFRSAMGIFRIIRRNESSWDKLFTGRLESLLPTEKRFDCLQQPDDSAWISAEATLNAIAVISWGVETFSPWTQTDWYSNSKEMKWRR